MNVQQEAQIVVRTLHVKILKVRLCALVKLVLQEMAPTVKVNVTFSTIVIKEFGK
jgi:hypothetical protein